MHYVSNSLMTIHWTWQSLWLLYIFFSPLWLFSWLAPWALATHLACHCTLPLDWHAMRGIYDYAICSFLLSHDYHIYPSLSSFNCRVFINLSSQPFFMTLSHYVTVIWHGHGFDLFTLIILIPSFVSLDAYSIKPLLHTIVFVLTRNSFSLSEPFPYRNQGWPSYLECTLEISLLKIVIGLSLRLSCLIYAFTASLLCN